VALAQGTLPLVLDTMLGPLLSECSVPILPCRLSCAMGGSLASGDALTQVALTQPSEAAPGSPISTGAELHVPEVLPRDSKLRSPVLIDSVAPISGEP
jgi:hypothetical protein